MCLLLGGDTPKTGAPLVAGASVEAEILEQGKGEKVIAFKKEAPQEHDSASAAHRQPFTKVKITAIHAS